MYACRFHRECVVCRAVFDYRDRGGKNVVTCCDKCSKKHTQALRNKAQKEWKKRQRSKACVQKD